MSQTPQPPPLLYVVKRLEQAIRSHLDELLRASDITALQYTALTVLERHDAISSAQLARDSFVTAQSMADLVAALERQGLISRAPHPESRRTLTLHLTERGQDLLTRVRPEVEALERSMTRGLTERQTQAFREGIDSCQDALRRG